MKQEDIEKANKLIENLRAKYPNSDALRYLEFQKPNGQDILVAHICIASNISLGKGDITEGVIHERLLRVFEIDFTKGIQNDIDGLQQATTTD